MEHRWTGAGAEVDLIVIKDRQLRFVEVKLRSTRDPVGLETVDARKLARIERAATVYLTQFDDFDEACVAVAYVQRGSEAWHIEQRLIIMLSTLSNFCDVLRGSKAVGIWVFLLLSTFGTVDNHIIIRNIIIVYVCIYKSTHK